MANAPDASEISEQNDCVGEKTGKDHATPRPINAFFALTKLQSRRKA